MLTDVVHKETSDENKENLRSLYTDMIERCTKDYNSASYYMQLPGIYVHIYAYNMYELYNTWWNVYYVCIYKTFTLHSHTNRVYRCAFWLRQQYYFFASHM